MPPPPPANFQPPPLVPPSHTFQMFTAPNTIGDGVSCDIWLPTAPAPAPASGYPILFYVHGGAFIAGTSAGFGRDADRLDFLSEQGVVAISVGYTKAPHFSISQTNEDIRSGFEWVVGGGAQSALEGVGSSAKLDSTRVGAMGHSAGGYFVNWLGSVKPELKAIVSYFGPVDWPAYAGWEGNNVRPDSAIHALIARQLTHPASTGCAFGPPLPGDSQEVKDRKELMREAESSQVVGFVGHGRLPSNDPILLATAAYPPIRFLHGTEDDKVWIQLSRNFERRLKELGVDAELTEIEGAGHGWPIEEGAEGEKGERWAIERGALKWFVEKLRA